MKEKINTVCPKNNKYFTGLTNDYEMNDGQQHFKCQDLEIFQIK